MRDVLLLLCWLSVPASALAVDVPVVVTDVPGSPIKQLLADAVLDARADALFAVLADVEQYASFVPYVVESTIVARDAGSIVNYQRLSFPIPGINDRHYAIRMRMERTFDADARVVYRIDWTLAPEIALPPRPSTVAVPVNAGFWYLQELERQPAATRVLYCVFTDPGGLLSAGLVSIVNKQSIPKLFDAVRAAALDERHPRAAQVIALRAAPFGPAPTSCQSDR